VCNGPDTDMAVEGVCGRFSSVPLSPFQSLTTVRCGATRFPVCVHLSVDKESGLDEEDAKNYRLISNLPVASKLLERLVAQQLIKYLSDHNLPA